MDQVKDFLEKHVQWIAVGLGGVVLLWALWAFVIQQSVGVELNGRFTGPADVDDEVLRGEGYALRSAMGGPPANVDGPDGDLGQNFQENLAMASNAPITLATSAIGSRPYLIPDSIVEGIDDGQIDGLPTIPVATMTAVGSGRAFVEVPDNANEPDGAFSEEDLNYVVGRFELDMAQLQAMFAEAALPPAGRRTTVLQVQPMRQRQLPDGTWTEAEPVAPLRNLALPEMPAADAELEVKKEYVAVMQELADDIVRPPFYRVIAGNDPNNIVGGPAPINPEAPADDNDAFDRGPADIDDPYGMPGDRTPGYPGNGGGDYNPYPGGGNRQGGGGYNPYPGGGNRQGGSGGRNFNAGTGDYGQTNGAANGSGNGTTLFRQDRDGRDSGGVGRGGGSGYNPYPGDSSGRGYPGQSGSPYDGARNPYGPSDDQGNDPAGDDQPRGPVFTGSVPADFAPGEVLPSIEGYFFDENIQQGETYRYNVVYSIKNPLFDTTNIVPQDNKELLETVAITVDSTSAEYESAWSEPISVESLTYWYMINKLPDNRVTFRVFKWQNGQWQSEDFKVEPGDSIGEMVGDIDYRTQQVLVDVRKNPMNARESYAIVQDQAGRFKQHTDDDRELDRYDELERASKSVASAD